MKNFTVMQATAGIHESQKTKACGLSWIPAFAGMTFLLVAFSLPAFAGSVNISNGKGMWQSTMCQRPIPPAFVGMGPEAPAGTLNAATGSYNQFVKQTQDYLACLSAEAKADSDATASLITATLEKQMRNAQGDVQRARAQLFGPGSMRRPPVSQPASYPAQPQPPQQQPQQPELSAQPPAPQPPERSEDPLFIPDQQ